MNDFAGVLKPEERQALSRKLADEDKKTTNQLAVVTIKTTGEEAIEDHSIQLVDAWKPGQSGGWQDSSSSKPLYAAWR